MTAVDDFSFQELKKFLTFLMSKVYNANTSSLNKEFIYKSFENCVNDVKYHFPNLSALEILDRITNNSNELAVWLYRLGRVVWEQNEKDVLLKSIHWLLKEICSCEIYFSSEIGKGFYIFHGEGLVIGSRNVIGNGLRVYQNVTIGHKYKNSNGVTIGNDVRIYSGAKVLGEITIADKVIIGSNTIVTKDIRKSVMVYGNPNITRPLNVDFFNKLI